MSLLKKLRAVIGGAIKSAGGETEARDASKNARREWINQRIQSGATVQHDDQDHPREEGTTEDLTSAIPAPTPPAATPPAPELAAPTPPAPTPPAPELPAPSLQEPGRSGPTGEHLPARDFSEYVTSSPHAIYNTFAKDCLGRKGMVNESSLNKIKQRVRVFSALSPVERGEVLVLAIDTMVLIRESQGYKNSYIPDRIRHDFRLRDDRDPDLLGFYDFGRYLHGLVEALQGRAMELTDEQGKFLFDADLHLSRLGLSGTILRSIKKALKRGDMPLTMEAGKAFLARSERILMSRGSRYISDTDRRVLLDIDEILDPKTAAGPSAGGKRTVGDEDADINQSIDKIMSYIQPASATPDGESHILAEKEAEGLARKFPSIEVWRDHTAAKLETLIRVAGQHEERAVRVRLVRQLESYRVYQSTAPDIDLVWEALLFLSDQTEKQSAPTGKWLTHARRVAAKADTRDLVARLLETIGKPPEEEGRDYRRYTKLPEVQMRGVIWLATEWPHEELAPALTAFGLDTVFRVNYLQKLANGILWYLANLPGGAGHAHLSRLSSRVVQPNLKRQLDKYLNNAAKSAGVDRDVLEDQVVPDHGLGEDGSLRLPLGGASARIAIVDTTEVEVSLELPAGADRQSVADALQADSDQARTIKRIAGQIREDLKAQLPRLQNIYLQNRRWSVADWRPLFGEHRLLRHICSRLIWNIHRGDQRIACLWRDGAFVDIAGQRVDFTDAEISLWHPMDDRDEVLAWRQCLAALEIRQPFNQAYREIYVITDAERKTGDFSKRFARHILLQTELLPIARAYHWKMNKFTIFDGHWKPSPQLVISAHGMVVDYVIKPAGDPAHDTIDGTHFAFLSGDQVRFHAIDPNGNLTKAGKPRKNPRYVPARGDKIPLEQVPPLVFSEVMRQVDLFVGQASIASIPDWMQENPRATAPSPWRQGVATDYWRERSFGILGPMAQTRRELLEKLLPLLNIGAQCTLEGSFLRVQGTRRTYRIHLGSSNIMMEPISQYLCIVPGQARAGDKDASRVRLPFEGDGTLSLILSKAFLLAADDKITDPVILNQIGRE